VSTPKVKRLSREWVKDHDEFLQGDKQKRPQTFTVCGLIRSWAKEKN
jgi:hypothetical protein